MVKTHKIALKPNKAQATRLSKHCGYARVAYNHALNAFRDGLKKDAFKSLYTLKREFNAVKHDEYEWSKALSQNASKNAIHHLDRAIKNWRNKKLPARFPTHRRRVKGQSYQADNKGLRRDPKRQTAPLLETGLVGRPVPNPIDRLTARATKATRGLDGGQGSGYLGHDRFLSEKG